MLLCSFLFAAMGSSNFPLLTPHNYATWKIDAWSKLMEKGLTHYIDGTIVAPADPKAGPVGHLDWLTKNIMAIGTLRKYVSKDLIFHIEKCTLIKDAWQKFQDLYGQVDEIRGYQIDSDLTMLDPKNFDTIQDYVTKANELRAQLKDCGIDKKDTQLIFNLIGKLPQEYVAFVSSFQTHRMTMGSSYKMPTFDAFNEMLMMEQTKLIRMGILKASKSQALVANQGNKGNQGKDNSNKKKWQSKPKEKAPSSPQQRDSFSSKRENSQKRERPTCAYCKKIGHEEHHCHSKKIDELTHIIKKHNIDLPKVYKKDDSSTSTSSHSKGKGQAFMASTSGKTHSFGTRKGKALCATISHDSKRWLLDSGASHHMASSQSMFSTFEPCTMPQILMGNHTYKDVIGKGSIGIGDNSFNNVLCVPHLTNNLLSIYQITHSATKRVVEFTPDSVFIRDMETRAIIATRVVDHASQLYSFSDFVDDDDFTFDDSTYDCDGSDFEENFRHLNMGILTCDPVLESCISSPHIDITSPIAPEDADSDSFAFM